MIFLLLLISGFTYSQGQNLIMNPTFSSSEITTNHYPNELRKTPIMASDWIIIAGAPDFFNDSKSTYLGFPLYNSTENSGGKIGLRMTNSKNEPEAVATKLSKELEKGKSYTISFTMMQSAYSNYSMNMIPFILSNEKVTKEQLTIQNDSRHICFLETKKNYLANDGWVTVSFIYKASGGEKYFTLLNNINNSARIEKSKANRMPFSFSDNQLEASSYYFFSKISIQLSTKDSDCKPIVLALDSKIDENQSWVEFKNKIDILSTLDAISIDNSELIKKKFWIKHHIFLIDVSGSMIPIMNEVIEETISLVNQIPDNDPISLVVFNKNSSLICAKSNKTKISNAIANLIADGATNLTDGLNEMYSLISPEDYTVLEIFTDQMSDALTFMDSKGSDSSRGFKNHYEFTKLPQRTIIKNLKEKTYYDEMLRHIYKQKNYADYFEFDSNFPTNALYSKECDSNRNQAQASLENQSIEKSTNFVYLIDVSASMNEKNKMDELKKSILQYNETLDGSHHVSLVSFSSTVTILLEGVHPKSEEFKTTIHDVKGKGATKIDDGIQHIYSNYKQTDNENVSFILFSDGELTLSQASEQIILEHPEIHLTIFQFGDRKNKRLIELTNNQKLVYRKVKPSNVKNELIQAEQEFPFPKKFSLDQPGVWKYFQNNILEITSKGYHD